MAEIVLMILVWLFITSILIIIIPSNKANRVMKFIKMALTLLPISAIINAFKNKKGDETNNDKDN